MYGNIAERCIEVIREICSANYVDIISGNVSPDHVHMLISAQPHLSVSKIVQYIKGKSSRKLRKEIWENDAHEMGWYFATSSGQISIKEKHNKGNSFKISEF